jgi:hypothetical protein
VEGRGLPDQGHLGEHGPDRRPGVGAGALTVPTAFSTAENDFTSPPGPIIVDFDATRSAGTPATLHIARERRLSAQQYLRIPGVDEAEARAIFDALVATGVWDAQGRRIVADVQQAAARASAARLPASVAPVANEVVNETAVQLAVHQFTAEPVIDVAAFFDRFVPPAVSPRR